MGRDDNIITKPRLPPKPQLRGCRRPTATGIITQENITQGNMEDLQHHIRHSRQNSSVNSENSDCRSQRQHLNSPVHTKPVPMPRIHKAPPRSHSVANDDVHNSSRDSSSGSLGVSARGSSERRLVLPTRTVPCPGLCQPGSECALTHGPWFKDNPRSALIPISRPDSKQHSNKGTSVHKTNHDEKPRRVPPNIPLPPRPLPRKQQSNRTNAGRSADCDRVHVDAEMSVQSDISFLTPGKPQQLGHLTSLISAVLLPGPVKPVTALVTCDAEKLTTQVQLKHPHIESVVLEDVRSELHRLFTGEDQEGNVDIKKLKITKGLLDKLIPSQSNTQMASEQMKSPQTDMCSFPSQNQTRTTADQTQIIPTENLERKGSQNDTSVPVEMRPLKEHMSKTEKFQEQSLAAVLPSSGLAGHWTVNYTHGDCKLSNDNPQKWPLERLWQERSVVRDKGILSQLTKEELLLQESMYEVLTSEQMYLGGLSVAVDHFQNSEELNSALTSIEHKLIFSDMHKIRAISQNFMSSLMQKLDSSLFCDVICDVVHGFAVGHFGAYVHYIRNMPYQKQALINLRKDSPGAVEVLSRLEEHPCCNRLPLESFLSLPFQRIPRLKILMEMVLKRTRSDSDLQASAERAVREISKVVEASNREVGKMKQMEELVNIANKTDFQCKSLPLVSSSRWLVKEGDMTQISLSDSIFGQKRLSPIHLFLFNDLLLVTTKKGSDRYVVQDHVHRSLIEVSEGSKLEEDLGGCDLSRVFQLALVKNHRGTTSHFLLQTSTQAERDAWVHVLNIQKGAEEGVYEEWDCPQVRCVEVYHGTQPGELSLQREDIVNIFQKTPDGYMEGRRLHDGQVGRFPAACVMEISNEHVQRRHLLQRYHVLQTATHMLKRHIPQSCHTTTCFR